MGGTITRLAERKRDRVNEHYHTSLDHIIITTVGVVVTIHVGRFVAGFMVKSQQPAVASAGKALGAVLSFGSS